MVAIAEERELQPEHESQLHMLVQEGVECLSGIVELPGDLKEPAAVIKAIKDGVDFLRAGKELPAEYAAPGVAAYGLGTLFGSAVQRVSGWEWTRLRLQDGSEVSALASPDRAHVLMPHHYFFRLLQRSDAQNTVEALFELIRDANLPPSHPGQLAILS
jgi:hypothetical protein